MESQRDTNVVARTTDERKFSFMLRLGHRTILVCLKEGHLKMNYVIGVDGGGTKTEAICYDMNGSPINKGLSGFSNVMIDFEKATQHILEAIHNAQNNLSPEDCLYIYLGIAGIEGIPNKDQLVTIIEQEFKTQVEIVNDSIIAHAALLEGQDGLLVISGTGSIAVGIVDGKCMFSGGWGHLLGDEGSGYWIVMEAFRQMIWEEDELFHLGQLSLSLLAEIGYTTVAEIKLFVYGKPKAEIASLAPVVTKLAELGDPIALRILDDAGKHLGRMTWNCCRKLGYKGQIRIGLSGSILKRIPFVLDSFKTYLLEKNKNITWVTRKISPTKGAYFLAKKALADQQKHLTEK